MAEIRTFCAVHPAEGLASKLAALPYDVYSRDEAREQVKKAPESFVSFFAVSVITPTITIVRIVSGIFSTIMLTNVIITVTIELITCGILCPIS